jgi:hypothetical protein
MNTCFHPYCKNPKPQFQSKAKLRLDETNQEEDETSDDEMNQYIPEHDDEAQTFLDGEKKIDGG